MKCAAALVCVPSPYMFSWQGLSILPFGPAGWFCLNLYRLVQWETPGVCACAHGRVIVRETENVCFLGVATKHNSRTRLRTNAQIQITHTHTQMLRYTHVIIHCHSSWQSPPLIPPLPALSDHSPRRQRTINLVELEFLGGGGLPTIDFILSGSVLFRTSAAFYHKLWSQCAKKDAAMLRPIVFPCLVSTSTVRKSTQCFQHHCSSPIQIVIMI